MFLNESKFHWMVLALVLLFGSYVRLSNLGMPSFWVDELDFVEAAQSEARIGEPLLPSGYAYPRAPFLTYSLVLSYKFLGVSEFSSRLPSAIFGILTILLVYVIGRKWFDSRTGLIAAILLACDPFAIGWSRACRMYALFQLSFMLGMLFFWQGFEGGKPSAAIKNNRKTIFQDWNLDPVALAVSAIFLFISYTSHQNAALFVFCLLGYLLVMFFYVFNKDGMSEAVKSKYGILVGLAIILFMVGMFIPQVSGFLLYALDYQPKWAEAGSAQNSWRIFSFLFGINNFPINLIFVVGGVLVLLKRHKAGLFGVVTLLTPVVFFSFVFQYRKNDYIYNVYPFFFLIAAYGLSWLISKLEMLVTRAERWQGTRGEMVQPILFVLCMIWLLLLPSFRFGQKIPRLPDGFFNGAIYHNEWKAASDFLEDKVSGDDALMSTLPLSIKYYLGRADYNLNWSNGDLAIKNQIFAQDGRLIDFYSGSDVVNDLDELKQVLSDRPNGWLVVDNYRFENPVYVPKDVHDFVVKSMPRVFESAQKTVSVYRWNSHKLQASASDTQNKLE